MSRVTVTDLVPGTEATSADVNATLNSWTAALAAGAISGENVRQEGLDRRSFDASAKPVYQNSVFYENSTGALNAIAAAYTPMSAGSTIQTGDIAVVASGDTVVVRAALSFKTDSTTGTILAGHDVDLVLQGSNDGGATWSTLSNTRQRFGVQYIAAGPGPMTPPFTAYTNACAVLLYVSTPLAGVNWRYRVAYISANDAVYCYNAVLYAEVYAR